MTLPAFRAAVAAAEQAALTDYYQNEILPQLPAALRPLSADSLLPTDIQCLRLQKRYILAPPNPQGSRELFEAPQAAPNAYDGLPKPITRISWT